MSYIEEMEAIQGHRDTINRLMADLRVLIDGMLGPESGLNDDEKAKALPIIRDIQTNGMTHARLQDLATVFGEATHRHLREWRASESGRFVQKILDLNGVEDTPKETRTPPAARGSIIGSIPGLLSMHGAMTIEDIQQELGTGYNGTKKALYTLQKRGVVKADPIDGGRNLYSLAPREVTA